MKEKENENVMFAECVPRIMKKAKGNYISPLREHLEHMMMIHTVFLMADMFLYNLNFVMIITELFYLWLCYFCYMTLKNYAFYAYISLLAFSPIYSFWTLLNIGPIKMLFYIVQLIVYSYFGGYITLLRYQVYAQEQNELEQEKKNRRNPNNVKDVLD